jgi:hypothetical protein
MDKDDKTVKAIFWLGHQIANLQIEVCRANKEMLGRGDEFEANQDACQEELCKILEIPFLK